MIHAAPDYPAEPERDADEIFEAHRDAEREAVSLEKGQCGARPLADRRGFGPGGGSLSTSPAAVRSEVAR